MPKISVILPVYNASEYLLEALESITNQTYTDWEMIAINDGSTDNSLELLQEYAKKEPRLRIISRENRGLPKSLNEGIKTSQGDYIARMDADDISFPNRFEKQLSFMIKNDLDLCGTQHLTIDTNIKSSFPLSDIGCRYGLLFSSVFSHPTVMAKKWVFNQYCYNEQYPCAQDYELWCRIVCEQPKIKLGNHSECLLNYRISPKQISSKNSKKQKSIATAIASKYWSLNSISKSLPFYPFIITESPEESDQALKCFLSINKIQKNILKNFGEDKDLIPFFKNKKFKLIMHTYHLPISQMLYLLKSCKEFSIYEKIIFLLNFLFLNDKLKSFLRNNSLYYKLYSFLKKNH